jgi:hypothetical protein
VISGKVALDNINGDNLNPIARSKGFKFDKTSQETDYITVVAKRAQLLAKFGHEIVVSATEPTTTANSAPDMVGGGGTAAGLPRA